MVALGKWLNYAPVFAGLTGLAGQAGLAGLTRLAGPTGLTEPTGLAEPTNWLDFINWLGWAPWFGWANWLDWSEPAGMRVYVPFLDACQLAAGKHSTTAQLAGRILEAKLVSISDGDTLQVKAPGRAPLGD